MLTVGALWGPIQLRAVTEVLKMGMVNSRNDRILYKEWFNGCIVPALRVSHYNEAKTFTRQDVQALYDICHANTWSNLSTEEAIQLLGLFKTIGLHSLEVAYTKLGDRDEKTWIKILTEIYGFSLEISQICYANKTTMITQALYTYSQKCHPPQQFYEIVALFQGLTYENLIQLGEMTVNPMLDVFLDLLPKDGPTDFLTFEVATSILMKYDSLPQIAAIKKELAKEPVMNWAKYDKRI